MPTKRFLGGGVRFKRFIVQNYKGIQRAVLEMRPGGANIFTLIGLNESGKSTMLEAIALFTSSENTELLYSGPDKTGKHSEYIPKEKQANFTGRINITAVADFEPGEKDGIIQSIESRYSCKIRTGDVKDEITYTRYFSYEESVNVSTGNEVTLFFSYKKAGGRKFIDADPKGDVWRALAAKIRESLPKIVFFPTFIFNFPNKILLNPPVDEDPVNKIYRQVVEDIGASTPAKINVQEHVVKKILAELQSASPTESAFAMSSKQREVSAALEQMSFHVSKTVFSAWKIILGSGYVRKEIVLRPLTETAPDGKHKVYIQFALRESGSVYDLSERSLGFRWFFSFLLFTLYRSQGNLRGSTLYLLDEPASHLHPKAQMQLLESFPKISGSGNYIIYSTHSHYMINPAWLEQAFIVANSAIEKAEAQDETGFLAENPTRVTLEKYRKFVGDRPDKITYYQTVLDKLQYAPSLVDFSKKSIVVEGKGDYIILSYVAFVLGLSDNDIHFVPTRGASGMDEIIGLLMGWAVPFCVCLDADRAGETAKTRYRSDWGLPPEAVFTYADISSSLFGARLEDLLDTTDLQQIATHFGFSGVPAKGLIRDYYSEMLASKSTVPVSSKLKSNVLKIFEKAAEAFGVR